MIGESIVLRGTASNNLLWKNIVNGSVQVRSRYEGGETYIEGKDYTVDYASGTIARTPASTIPDYTTHPLYGIKDFDHNKYPAVANADYFVWVDYQSPDEQPLSPAISTPFLKKTAQRLRSGQPLKIVAFGDSITLGGDATRPQLAFTERYADWLRSQHPTSDIVLINGATGGDTSSQGLERINEKVIQHQPDLVLLGFGMNDHNIEGYGVEPALFEQNLRTIVRLVREQTPAELLMYSTFPPNPDWHFGTHRMETYAQLTRSVAGDMQVAFADLYAAWMKALTRKDHQSLLANNINHPNDWGHALYFDVLKRVTME